MGGRLRASCVQNRSRSEDVRSACRARSMSRARTGPSGEQGPGSDSVRPAAFARLSPCAFGKLRGHERITVIGFGILLAFGISLRRLLGVLLPGATLLFICMRLECLFFPYVGTLLHAPPYSSFLRVVLAYVSAVAFLVVFVVFCLLALCLRPRLRSTARFNEGRTTCPLPGLPHAITNG